MVIDLLTMNRDDIIKYILDSKLLDTCVDYQLKKQPQHYKNRDDIIQDAWMWLLTYDADKLSDAFVNNHLNALLTRYIQNQLFSKTSDYYRRYIKFNNLTENLESDAERTQSGLERNNK